MVFGDHGDLTAHALKLAEPELKQELGPVTILLLSAMVPRVQDPQTKTQIVILNPVQVMYMIYSFSFWICWFLSNKLPKIIIVFIIYEIL